MQFTAEVRSNFGTIKVKNLRKKSLVPGTIYKKDGTLLHISLQEKELSKAVQNPRFLSTYFTISVGGTNIMAIYKDVDFHPVNEKPIHIEFKEASENENVSVFVPIEILNRSKSVGIKTGGKLNVPQHSLLVLCKPSDIPSSIPIDIEKFGIGRVIFTRNIAVNGSYSFPKDVFVLSILGRGRKDKGEEESKS